MLLFMLGKLRSFLLFLFCPVFMAAAEVVNYTPFNPDYINSDVFGVGECFFENDVVIADDSTVAPDVIKITGSVIIENNGTIQSDIEICNGCVVVIRNSGQINANFIVGKNAFVYHVISEADEIVPINFNAPYTMFVESNTALSLADVVDAANGADKIIFKNTKLNIDRLPANKMADIEIGENVVFVMNGDMELESEIVLGNVISDSSVRFESSGCDKMYSCVGYIKDGKLYVEQTRNTEYKDIIEDKDKSNLVDNLPENDALVEELDSAVDTNQINKIMSKSARFNPDVLRVPLKIINEMDMIDLTVPENKIVAKPFAILSDDFYLYGAGLTMAGNVTEDLNLSVGISVAKMEYASDYDEFSGILYGINFGGNYSVVDDWFVRFKIGASIADFDIDSVLYDGKLISGPSARFGYGLVDLGYDFNDSDSWKISPFVGVSAQFYDVENNLSYEYMGRVGTAFEYKYNASGLEYHYGLDLFVNTDSTMAATANLGFTSLMDSVGGNVSATILRAENIWNYKLSISAKLLF